MQKNKKFCPRCGALIHAGDTYCIRCGYNFKRRPGSKTSLRTILIVIVVLLVLWGGVRLITNQPIIPNWIVDIFKNMTSSKTA